MTVIGAAAGYDRRAAARAPVTGSLMRRSAWDFRAAALSVPAMMVIGHTNSR